MTASTDFELLFESAPISLWLEDYSALKALFTQWRTQGIVDLGSYLRKDPISVAQCSQCYKVLQVNRQTLRLYGAASQQELVARLPEVFRGDMFEHMVTELVHLWNGELEFSSQGVNYTLDGRRMDVQIHVRVLEGHEDTWDRVMVSLQEVTAHTLARLKLEQSEQHARNLFDLSPVSLWVEDFSGVKRLMDEVRHSGIQDFRVFLSVHAEFVTRCMEQIRVLDVNQHTLDMFAATDRADLLGKLDLVFKGEMSDSFAEQLLDLWNGKTMQTREVINYSLTGELINIHMQFTVMPGHEADWDLVLVSLVDITARKKAEAYLEYLGKHDALTRLRNRAFYVEELNRISRKGPWPLSIVAMDLNGLKAVNDNQGHAAGDAMLRRAGEVLAKAAGDQQPLCMARIGGDEFVALMPGSDERAANGLKERIESMLELNNQFYPGQKLSLALGIATCNTAAEVEATIHAADQSMFKAKQRFYETTSLERRRV
ncbi:sensor domain-containing diguanylate cyclase [Rhodoferax saidenbachensis]|uniref:Diguanylate cyclase (GGDEF)-like protein n=1 Tax=Rhodoferax saidenbachensis TaxID=1484693 RepID=A0ABU1ZTF1_9BURK|nr:sensor domain-containing diguanylate cyclase [Rhodoferax saidenbachensis]MDR7308842.1 diguanylate cyclase (GGDEF)-like protein [Rhodoferax saidenbachensis]